MRIIVSVVSHQHHDLIINFETLLHLAKHDEIVVICRENIPTEKLRIYTERHKIILLQNSTPKSFSANNNLNFKFYCDHLNPKHDDFFLLLNPDVILEPPKIKQLISTMPKLQDKIYTINLYHDRELLSHDDNIRTYPRFLDFIRTYLFNHRVTMVDRSQGLPNNGVSKEYWASCAFMLMKANIYKKLRGLNEIYYLYCEDIEICSRAIQEKIYVELIEDINAIHLRRRKSLNFLSSHFRYHVSSIFKYELFKRGLLSHRTIL